MRIRSLVVTGCLGIFVAGSMLAQAPPQPRPRFGGPGGPGGPRGAGPGFQPGFSILSEQRLTKFLNLDAEQQNKIHSSISEASVMSKGIGDQMAAFRAQLAIAVKAGDEGKIDQATRDIANLQQQQQSIQAKAMAKVYAALNPEQKAKIDQQLSAALGVRAPRPKPAAPGVPQ